MTTTFSLGLAGPVAAAAASGRGSRMGASKASISRLHRRHGHAALRPKASPGRCRFSWEYERLALITGLGSFVTSPIPGVSAARGIQRRMPPGARILAARDQCYVYTAYWLAAANSWENPSCAPVAKPNHFANNGGQLVLVVVAVPDGLAGVGGVVGVVGVVAVAGVVVPGVVAVPAGVVVPGPR